MNHYATFKQVMKYMVKSYIGKNICLMIVM